MMFNQSFSPWGMSGCFLRRLVAYTRDCRSRTLELYSTYHVRHFLPPRNVCFGVFPVSSHGCPTTQCPSLASMPSSKHVFRFSHSIPVLADMYNLLDVYLHSVSLKPGLFFSKYGIDTFVSFYGPWLFWRLIRAEVVREWMTQWGMYESSDAVILGLHSAVDIYIRLSE